MSRKIDEAKKEAIKQAVYELTMEEGLVALSMGKVAKRAQVSPATLYIYYKDKTDMLSRIYEGVKDIMDDGLPEKLAKLDNLDDKLRVAVHHFILRFRENTSAAQFMWAIQNNLGIIDQVACDYAEQKSADVLELFKEMLNNPDYENMSLLLASSLFEIPYTLQTRGATDSELEEAIEILIKAFKK
ncbi:MAG: TetR/AcrR family transcriptional regulator [Streptococcaceae bacterium]|jgi:AcrR family transcriptional regulator|nr:TetR/AcrR family transcriptional regulator [Streptococcaceae bacterium]